MSGTSSGPRASRGASLAMQGGRDGCELLLLAKDAQARPEEPKKPGDKLELRETRLGLEYATDGLD
ncbi:hypothetical protein MKX08_008886 [Trichoderma sp. CBMAI-0020]|nr:hypothetical protein MKX08_008886 [Trichoderma sp. CBMAI-0020]